MRQFHAGVLHRAFKHAVVVRAGGGDNVIFRRFRRAGLQQLLQLALRIFNDRQHAHLAERGAEFAQDEFTRHVEAAVQKNRAEQRLERVRQRGRAFPPAVHFLAVAQHQLRAEAERAGVFGQRAAVDELRARLGQRAFVEGGKFFIQLPGEDELQHRVAEKLEPLVVRGSSLRFVAAGGRRAAFMCDGRMRQREAQLAFVAKLITETVLKCGKIGHCKAIFDLRFMIDDWRTARATSGKS